jgi:hypothetical protein
LRPDRALVGLPSWIWEAICEGRAIGEGALVKDATTNAIIAHLQASGPLAHALATPTIDATGLVVSASELVHDEPVHSMLSALGVVAGVGAATAVLHLGPSTGGFEPALDRLRAITRDLEAADRKADAVTAAIERAHVTDILIALERCERAFASPEDRRAEIWLDEEHVLQRSFAFLLLVLFGDDGAAMQVPWSDVAVEPAGLVDALAWPMRCLQARIDALLLARRPAAARAACDRAARWLGGIGLDIAAYVRARPSVEATRSLEHARAIAALIGWCRRQVLDDRALCDVLVTRDLDSRAYVEGVRMASGLRVLALLR